MKKLFGCFLCVMLLAFGAAASVQAVTCTDVDCAIAAVVAGTAGQVGHPDTEIGDLYYGSGVSVYGATDLNTWFGTLITGVFTEFNEFTPYESGDLTSGEFDFTSLSGSYQYLSVKFNGYVALYDIADCDYLDWNSPTVNAYSPNARLWGPTSVPEPATMLLLGFGLIGLAGFGRKKLIKK